MSEYCDSYEDEDDCDDCDKDWPECVLTELQGKFYNIQIDVLLKYSPLEIPHEEFIKRAKEYEARLNG